MIKQLAHVCIGAKNLAEAEHFYCDILDMKKGFEFLKNGELYGFYVKSGEDTYLEIFIQEEAPNFDRPILKHLCLEVENIDTVISDIRSKGWEITDKKRACDQSWQAWITDPSGIRIEITQYTETSSQFTGKPCIVDW